MAIADDWTINYTAKTITHTAGTTIYTVNEMYSWIQDTFDELVQLDDDVPMSAQTPTAYTLINGWSIPASSYEYLKGGAITDTTNDDLWANVYTLGSIVTGQPIYIVQNGTKLTSYWADGHIDLLIRVKQSGVEIDSGIITVFARDYGNLFDHFQIDLTAGGRNAVPLATSTDLNNQTASGTVATYSDITLTFGAASKNLNNGNGAQPYGLVIDCATRPLAQVYEYLKYITREGSVYSANGTDGEQYKSLNSSYTEVKASPFGTFAGGTFFGARGVWIENYDANDAKSFQLIDSNGVTQTPPNVVPVVVSSVVSGDRVAVFRLTGVGGTIDKTRYTLASGNNIGNGTIVVNETIATDEPASGIIRIGEDRYTYTSYSVSTFTLSGTLSSSYALNTDCYVPIIDVQASATTASTTLIYSADIPVIVRVRKKGILPFENTATIGSTGLSVSAIRTTDGVVT